MSKDLAEALEDAGRDLGFDIKQCFTADIPCSTETMNVADGVWKMATALERIGDMLEECASALNRISRKEK